MGLKLMQKDIEKIFVNLITKQLKLPDNYGTDENGNQIPCVIIKAQNIKLFNTPHLQITISTVSNNVYSNRRETFEEVIDGKTKFFERLLLNEQRLMQIDIYSRNNEARERLAEVQTALTSTLAQELQDLYQFKIAKISNAVNLSGLDGGSDLNRYAIRFNCICWQEIINEIDYYSTFRTTVQDRADSIFIDFTTSST